MEKWLVIIQALPLLLGMGLDAFFSMSATSMLRARALMSKLSNERSWKNWQIKH
nr:hypothetical protein [Entomoplasma sp. MP1]